MTITPQNGDLTAGIAGQYSEDVSPALDALTTGDHPAVFTTDETVLTGQVLAAWTVVGFDGAGKIVPANNTTVPAVGILVYPTDTSATGTNSDATGAVYRGGCFNPDLLVWDVAYSTDALKAKAFEGAPSPTQIITKKIQTFTPV